LAHQHGSCTYRALGGDEWTLTDHLLALIHDQLAIANWQRSKDGQRDRNRPKPMSPLLQRESRRERRIGHTDRTPDEVRALLAQLGPRG